METAGGHRARWRVRPLNHSTSSISDLLGGDRPLSDAFRHRAMSLSAQPVACSYANAEVTGTGPDGVTNSLVDVEFRSDRPADSRRLGANRIVGRIRLIIAINVMRTPAGSPILHARQQYGGVTAGRPHQAAPDAESCGSGVVSSRCIARGDIGDTRRR